MNMMMEHRVKMMVNNNGESYGENDGEHDGENYGENDGGWW